MRGTAITALAFALVMLVGPHTALSRIWYVTPDGFGDAPTIQAGLDSSSAGDTVLVACGTYYERNIIMKSGVALLGESGEADCVTVDGEYLNTVFKCGSCNSLTLIRGFTITRGMAYLGNPGSAGGMKILSSSGLVIENCEFVSNRTHYGAGVFCQTASPAFVNCVFRDNYGISLGGGLYCDDASPQLEGCLFVGNRAGWGVGCSVQ